MTDKNISKYIGRRIKYYREQKGLTQKELGALVGIKHNTISSYENATNKPDQNILFSIAQALNIGIDDFFPPIKDSLVLKEEPEAYSTGSIVMLPIVGHISCGDGNIAYEDIEGYESVPEEWIKGGKYFLLRAKGDSMIGARIHEDDLLLIREQPEVENGEIAAVLINGGEAVLKRIYRSDGQLVLQSENSNYPSIFSPPVEVKIIGKLKKIIITV